ncbi:ribonuclease HI family protein [Patescibacteria group bacterium]|nr:ribonuclease HI family protein [Patescibacteria group bacterium]MCL5410203.1 ribonuclease HI family protein [Patescibacteria group bacterium]
MEENKYHFIINTDGASRQNPGFAAAAFIVKDPAGKVLLQEGKYLGIATNNEAEYRAVINALAALLLYEDANLPTKVLVKADSLLVIQQLRGIYKIKSLSLKNLFEQVKQLEQQIGLVDYVHIKRSENSEADLLGNIALDQTLN